MKEADVLVVEDDAAINELIGEYLRLEGHTYRSALDGGNALREVYDHAPNVVVLDVMLPDIDGFEICRRLKSDPLTKKVPVVMLSALADEQSRQTGMQCGAAEYITKPFQPDQLMQAIKQHGCGRNGHGQAE